MARRNQFDYKDIRKALIAVLDFVTIPNTDKQVIINALQSNFTDFEDATQMYCAKDGKADVIITRDVKDFIHSEIPTVTPIEFLIAHQDLL